MQKVLVYYESNKMPSLEERVLETARRYRAKVISEFNYENQVFSAMIEFNNEGQVNNFKNDLIIIGNSYKIKINLGGFV